MARYTSAKCRLCRQEGIKLFLKSERCFSNKCPVEKKGAVPPGQHGHKRARKPSNYGEQLRAKQKAKRFYGVLERQLHRYFDRAIKVKGATGKVFLQLLESRLDNVIYRLGLVPSRSVARQLINHGHVLIDDRKVDIPSYEVKPEQTIRLSNSAMTIETVRKQLAEKKPELPGWLRRKGAIGQMLRLPEDKDLVTDINEQLIVEYYSR